jgi:hypothetical protein
MVKRTFVEGKKCFSSKIFLFSGFLEGNLLEKFGKIDMFPQFPNFLLNSVGMEYVNQSIFYLLTQVDQGLCYSPQNIFFAQEKDVMRSDYIGKFKKNADLENRMVALKNSKSSLLFRLMGFFKGWVLIAD